MSAINIIAAKNVKIPYNFVHAICKLIFCIVYILFDMKAWLKNVYIHKLVAQLLRM